MDKRDKIDKIDKIHKIDRSIDGQIDRIVR